MLKKKITAKVYEVIAVWPEAEGDHVIQPIAQSREAELFEIFGAPSIKREHAELAVPAKRLEQTQIFRAGLVTAHKHRDPGRR